MGAAGDGTGSIITMGAAGDGPGAIIIFAGAGAIGIIFFVGAAGAIITGLAEAAGDASMTLGGAGARLSRPTPIRAKFESSRERGHGSSVKVDTLGEATGFTKERMDHAIKSPRPILVMD